MEYINRMAPIRKSGGICTENLRQNGGKRVEIVRQKHGKSTEQLRNLYGKAARSKISESGVGLVVIFILHFTYNEPIR